MKTNVITRKNERIKEFSLDQVRMLDPYFTNAFEKEIEYLTKFDVDRLVAGFRENKGLECKADKYAGWESTEIRGHSLGHVLTALAQAYRSSKNKKVLEMIYIMIDELELCQFDNGYLSAFSEELFDNVENSKPAWVPWYTMDKILSGLVCVYELVGYEKAIVVASALGDWVYERTSRWTEEIHKRVLSVEYGGMNQCLYDLYKITKSEKHKIAAHMFDELSLFEELQKGHDILNGKHANTTIPKVLGALNRYRALGEGEEFYLEVAEAFWDMVTQHHSYITGGNSEWEHFGEPDILEGERTNCNCETCNTYNMLKLSRELFKITKDVKYADFYEQTLINAIMSSQNPDTGMTMYFQPMATGYFKVYGTEFDKFWCCTGTGMENFTKLNDSIYFYNEDTLFINQYRSSSVTWEDKNLKLVQESNIPETEHTIYTIHTIDGKETKVAIAIRIPHWIRGKIEIEVNEKMVSCDEKEGYVYLEGNWRNEDKITVKTPMQVFFEALPDDSHSVAFQYGPVVLSAGLGTEDLIESTTGVNVTVPTKYRYIKDYIIIKSSIDQWLKDLPNHIIKKAEAVEFTLTGTDEDERLVFRPHYLQHKERYGLYWNLMEEGSKELDELIRKRKEEDKRQSLMIDSFPVGNDQYELQHKVEGRNTEAGAWDGRNFRHAWPEGDKKGCFSYEVKVNPEYQNYLTVTYFSGNEGRIFDIYIEEELLIEENIGYEKKNSFYNKTYAIPMKLIDKKRAVRVRFQTVGDGFAGGIFDLLSVTRGEEKL